MAESQTLRDVRALSLPDEAFSAYCKVCWHVVYALWSVKEPHGGVCAFGDHNQARDCDEARRRDFNKEQMRRAKAGLPPLPLARR